MRLTSLICVCALGGCQAPSQVASTSFGSSITTAPAGSTTEASTTDSSSTGSAGSTSSTSSTGGEDSSAGASSGTTLILDVGAKHDLDNPQPAGCKGKIDFLFVISRHSVTQEIQAKLVAAFPDFIAAIETKFADFDYHIMVADADDHWGSMKCGGQCPILTADCEPVDYPCDYVPTACDQALGAGTVFNAGFNAPNKPCELASGRRYIEKGQPELTDTFTCIAQVGTSGYNWIGAAVAAAVSPELTGPGGCNEGFLRDDALLMVTMIGPPDDFLMDSPGKPKEWAQTVLDAKHGDENAVVMFRIGAESCPSYDRACTMAKYYFPYHHISNQSDAEYGPAFDVATDLVETACSAFIPG